MTVRRVRSAQVTALWLTTNTINIHTFGCCLFTGDDMADVDMLTSNCVFCKTKTTGLANQVMSTLRAQNLYSSDERRIVVL